MDRNEIAAEEVRRLLHYDPATGEFTRKVTTAGNRGREGSVAGTINEKGYRLISIHSRQYRADRLAWLYVTGSWPNIDVAHENGDRDDNRWENLRDEKPMSRRKRRSPEREAMLHATRPKPETRHRSDGSYVKHSNEHMVPIELLQRRVSYDPDTGELRWKGAVPVADFIDERARKIWHSKFAGRPIMKRNRGYVVVSVSVNLRTIYCQGHRVAWALMTGAWPDNEIDHRDGDRGNNKWSNLREATHQTNQWNKGLMATNTSGFKGVHPEHGTGRWVSQITINGRTRHLGAFANPEEAANAYRAAADRIQGGFAAQV